MDTDTGFGYIEIQKEIDYFGNFNVNNAIDIVIIDPYLNIVKNGHKHILALSYRNNFKRGVCKAVGKNMLKQNDINYNMGRLER